MHKKTKESLVKKQVQEKGPRIRSKENNARLHYSGLKNAKNKIQNVQNVQER